MLIHAHLCSFMLIYAHLCSFMLIYTRFSKFCIPKKVGKQIFGTKIQDFENGKQILPTKKKLVRKNLVPKFSYLETLSYKLSEKKVSTKKFFFSPRSRPDKLLDFFSLKSLFRDNDQSLQHTQTPQNHQQNPKKSKKIGMSSRLSQPIPITPKPTQIIFWCSLGIAELTTFLGLFELASVGGAPHAIFLDFITVQ